MKEMELQILLIQTNNKLKAIQIILSCFFCIYLHILQILLLVIEMRIGIPKAMATYEYPILFESFFKELGIDVVYSNDTNKKIMNDGIKYSVDEACLASKICLGHVKNLIDRGKREKIDAIFIPRICSFRKNETVCVKFYAMYDICKTVFDYKFVTLNLDEKRGKNELIAFLNLGHSLGVGYSRAYNAYKIAKKKQTEYYKLSILENYQRLQDLSYSPNILIVSHPYVINDKYIGVPLVNYLEGLGANIFYSNINESLINKKKSSSYKNYSSTLYWKFSKNVLNGISDYIEKIDGIIYISSFPCGPDSLVTELTMRSIKDIPSINILLDEQDGNAGIYTRLESFFDILDERKKLQKGILVNE